MSSLETILAELPPVELEIDNDLRLETMAIDDHDAFHDYIKGNRGHLATWDSSWEDIGPHKVDSLWRLMRIIDGVQHGWGAYYKVVQDDTFVGTCSLHDRTDDVAYMGYSIRQDRQGRKITSRAATRLRDFGWEWGLQEIRLAIMEGNVASQGVARAIGARPYGDVIKPEGYFEQFWKVQRA